MEVNMSDLVRLRIEMAQDDLALEQETVDGGLTIESVSPLEVSKPKPLEEGRFVEPVIIIATATLAVIAKRVVEHWLKRKEQGVQIDLRTTPPTFSSIANVPRGFVVIIDMNGGAKPHKIDYEKGESLVPFLSQFIKKS
jgi:hypothetical protein